jgi:gp32 DNA binding protein like
MSTFDAVLAQYEKNSQSNNSTQRVSSEERLKRYFAPILQKGEASGNKTIRIIPTKDGTTPFVEVYFHEVQVGGKWVKLYDPSQNGTISGVKSPLNDVFRALQMTGSEADKTLSYGYKPRKFYIVKVIDRENEQDGPKFWRFKHSGKKDGVLDKIVSLWKIKGDITDPNTGRDLTISLNLSRKPNGGEYTTITAIFPDDSAPMSTNTDKQAEWLNEATTWEDVYAKKPLEYLEGVAQGFEPKWSSESKKYVWGDEAELVIGAPASAAPAVDPQQDAEVDEDLPF